MPAPLQPTPLDPTAAQGGVSLSQAYDSLLQGNQLPAANVPAAPMQEPQQPAQPRPSLGDMFDKLVPPPQQAQPKSLSDAFDQLSMYSGNADDINAAVKRGDLIPVVPPGLPELGENMLKHGYIKYDDTHWYVPKTVEQTAMEAAIKAEEPDTDSSTAIQRAEGRTRLLPSWVPGSTILNNFNMAIEGGKEAIVQGLTKVGILSTSFDQDRMRRDLNMLEQASAGPIPEMDLYGLARRADEAGMYKTAFPRNPGDAAAGVPKPIEPPDVTLTKTMPSNAESIADQAAAKAPTAEAGQEIHDKVMGEYWSSQDAATEETQKRIGMTEVLTDPKPMNQPIMSIENQKSMVAAGIRILQGRGIKPNSLAPETVQQLVSGLVKSQGDMSGVAPHEIFLALEDANEERRAAGLAPLTTNDFANWFVQSGTDASNMLNARRQFWEQLRQRALMGDQEAQGLVDASTSNGELRNLYQRMTGDWKMALVSNLSVAMRNLWDGVIYQGYQTAARGLDVLVNRTARLINPDLPQYTTWAPFSDFNQIFNPLQWNQTRKEVGQLAGAFPQIQKDLGVNAAWRASQVAPGATAQVPGIMGTALRVLTTGHQLQEGILRRAVFAASMDRKLATMGTSMADIIKTGDIPKGFNGIMRDSIHDALDAAWSLDLDTHGTSALRNAVAGVLHWTSSFPGIGPLVEAFPRYLYTQIQHVLDYQPLGFLKLASPTERAAIAAGEPNAISKAVVGSAAFATFLAARKGMIPGVVPGDNWDEFKIGNQTISLKPFGTAAPYMYLADTIHRLQTGNHQQGYFNVGSALEGLFGNNPMSGGMQLDVINKAIDVLSQARVAGTVDYSKLLGEVGNEFAGLFNPLRQLWDFASEWEESLRTKRTTGGMGITGGARQLTYPQSLPEKPNPTQAGPEQMAVFNPGGVPLTGGMLHQLTGAQYGEAPSAFQSEIDRLGFTHEILSPHLGVEAPRATQLVYQNLGPLVQRFSPMLLNSPIYQNNPDTVKAALIHDFLHGGPLIPGPGLMDAAKGLAAAQAPHEFANIKLQTSIPVDDQRGVDAMMNGRLQTLYQQTKAAGDKELTGLKR